MLVLGLIVIVGLALHLVHFWSKMMLPELAGCDDMGVMMCAANGIYHIENTFGNIANVVFHLVWLAALWFHLTHGFWSAMQTLGWNNKVWLNLLAVHLQHLLHHRGAVLRTGSSILYQISYLS